VILIVKVVNTKLAYDGYMHNLQSNKERVFYCKGNLMIKHNAQILTRGIQSILDKYNIAEECIPCKGDPKRKL